jgi:phosphoglycerol transferase MdoB-like AlkP superfamily enzyme
LPIVIFAVLPFITRADKLNNEFIYFVKSIYQKDEIIDYYQNSIYNNLIQQSSIDKNRLIEEAKKINKENLPKYLDNIIILQIESLNSFLVNEKNTPNFMEISRQGIFFPKFYGNSVQTIMAQENILCSLPSSFDMNLVESGEDKNILCLPEIFKYLDYKTFFIKSYDLRFAQTGEFMKNLKFDEIHADDIMGQDNIKYPWGYREDIFYKKSFDYLKKNKKDKLNFFYIEIGPTNHWPFKTPEDMGSEALYKNPENHEQRLINTTYIQDRYLKIAWEEINKIFPEKNYTLLILGDHSWPAGIHEDNTFNEKGSYEENFLTSMIMIIGDEKKYKRKIINKKYSEMDIGPSILNLFQIDSANKFARSFIKELNGQTESGGNLLLIQPFSNKYINVITSENTKYQYDGGGKKMIIYNLNRDPGEENGQIIGKEKKNILNMIKNLTE